MSDDGSDDGSGSSSGGGGGFFSWFWNAVVGLFGGGDSGDGAGDTTNSDKNADGDTTTGNPPATATGEPPAGDAGTTVDVSPTPNTSTTAAGADESANAILPPGHDTGVWYQKVDGQWVRTDLTDERDLGLGEFAKDDGEGLTSIHISGGPSQDAPNDPKMTGYTESWKQGPNDVAGVPGGTPNPNTWVYLYTSIANLPGFLQPTASDETAWQVPSQDGGPSYQVFVQENGQVIVWRTK